MSIINKPRDAEKATLHLCETEIGAKQVRRVLAVLEYGAVV